MASDNCDDIDISSANVPRHFQTSSSRSLMQFWRRFNCERKQKRHRLNELQLSLEELAGPVRSKRVEKGVSVTPRWTWAASPLPNTPDKTLSVQCCHNKQFSASSSPTLHCLRTLLAPIMHWDANCTHDTLKKEVFKRFKKLHNSPTGPLLALCPGWLKVV